MAYVPLHLHSEYSLLDGAIRFEPLMRRAKELGLSALALTDHGNLHGAVEFYYACRKAGIHPVLGCELYVAPGSRFERAGHGLQDHAHHLVVLARDLQGYKNLLKLSTLGYLQGFYYKPRVDREALKAHSRGLIALSGCLQGEIPSAIRKGALP
jgi:DNA polymerase-3 subunit alpha